MIKAQGSCAFAYGGNSSEAANIAEAVATTHEALDPIEILVNNAALSPFCKFEDLTEELRDNLMAINLKGPFLCCKAIIPDMVEAGWGRIINMSSSSAQTGSAAQTYYAASKGGVIGFTKSLAQEYATRGITVNNVPPGFVHTEGLEEGPSTSGSSRR